jgi:hypothetical protein
MWWYADGPNKDKFDGEQNGESHCVCVEKGKKCVMNPWPGIGAAIYRTKKVCPLISQICAGDANCVKGCTCPRCSEADHSDRVAKAVLKRGDKAFAWHAGPDVLNGGDGWYSCTIMEARPDGKFVIKWEQPLPGDADVIKHRWEVKRPDEEGDALKTPEEGDGLVAPVGTRVVHERGSCGDGWLGKQFSGVRDTLEECADYCKSLGHCGYFAYSEFKKLCATYSPWQRCPIDKHFDYMDSKTSSFVSYQDLTKDIWPSASWEATYSFLHYGHCSHGWIDGQNIETQTLQECAHWCEDFKICKYFSWNHGTKQCSLFSAWGKCTPDGRYPDSVTYELLKKHNDHFMRSIQDAILKPYYFVGDGICGFGTQILAQEDTTMEDCLSMCYSTEDCMYFSYGKAQMQCSLHSDNGCSEGSRVPGWSSYQVLKPKQDTCTTIDHRTLQIPVSDTDDVQERLGKFALPGSECQFPFELMTEGTSVKYHGCVEQHRNDRKQNSQNMFVCEVKKYEEMDGVLFSTWSITAGPNGRTDYGAGIQVTDASDCKKLCDETSCVGVSAVSDSNGVIRCFESQFGLLPSDPSDDTAADTLGIRDDLRPVTILKSFKNLQAFDFAGTGQHDKFLLGKINPEFIIRDGDMESVFGVLPQICSQMSVCAAFTRFYTPTDRWVFVGYSYSDPHTERMPIFSDTKPDDAAFPDTTDARHIQSFIKQVHYPGVRMNCKDAMQTMVDHCSQCESCQHIAEMTGNRECYDAGGVCMAHDSLYFDLKDMQDAELNAREGPEGGHRRYGVCDQTCQHDQLYEEPGEAIL